MVGVKALIQNHTFLCNICNRNCDNVAMTTEEMKQVGVPKHCHMCTETIHLKVNSYTESS